MMPSGLLLALCLPVMIACIDIMAVSVALNPIMRELHAALGELQWLISAYTLGTASFLIVIGKLADLHGRRRSLLLGIIFFGVSSFIAMLTHSILILIFCRFLQGVASSMMMVTVISIITHHFPKEIRGNIIAKWATSLGIGMSLGPLVGGLLIHFFNWRAIFLINIPICLFCCILVLKFISESRDEGLRIKINWFEAFLLNLSLLLLVGILSEGAVLGWHSSVILILTAIFVACLVFFLLFESRQKHPLIDVSLFGLTNFAGASSCGFLSYFCMYAWLFVLGVYLQSTYGFTALQSGCLFVSFSVASAFAAQFVGKVIQRLGPKVLMQSGFLLAILAFLWMATITPETPAWKLIIMFAMLGLMLTLVNVPSMSAATKYVPANKAGVASGIIFTIRWLGGSIGVALIAFIFEHGLHSACWALMAAAVLGLFSATLLIQKEKSI